MELKLWFSPEFYSLQLKFGLLGIVLGLEISNWSGIFLGCHLSKKYSFLNWIFNRSVAFIAVKDRLNRWKRKHLIPFIAGMCLM